MTVFAAMPTAAGTLPASQGIDATVDAANDAPDGVRLMLYAGEVKVLHLRRVKRVALGNGKLVSVQQVGDQLILIGQAAGATNLLLWHQDGSMQAFNIVVTAQDSREAAAGLASALGSIPGLKVAETMGRVVLTGDLTPDDYKQVEQIAQSVPGVVNLTRPGTVDMQRMVYLDVQVVDFKKSALRNLGIDWQSAIAGPALGIVKDWRTNPYFRLGDLTQGGNASNSFQGAGGNLTGLPVHVPFSEYFGITSSLSSVINIAAQHGDAYVLANPQLSTRSEGTASFLAGGQIPIPITSVLGQSSVQYKDYGVHLDIKPVADAHGNVMADINTEVSQIDPSVTIQGFPGFLTRKTSSVVNVRSGQTIVLSGLVQAGGSNSINKFPALGDIPILGYLFRDKNFNANKSELVIFVTPQIIDPTSPVNAELIDRGTGIIEGFDRQYGTRIGMPGFGIGPGSHPQEQPAGNATPPAVHPGASTPAPAHPGSDGMPAKTAPPLAPTDPTTSRVPAKPAPLPAPTDPTTARAPAKPAPPPVLASVAAKSAQTRPLPISAQPPAAPASGKGEAVVAPKSVATGNAPPVPQTDAAMAWPAPPAPPNQ